MYTFGSYRKIKTRVPHFWNTLLLTVAGYVMGMCSSTRLTVGDNYVVMSDSVESNDVFSASVTRQVDWNQLPDYTRACGLLQMYPLGMRLISCL